MIVARIASPVAVHVPVTLSPVDRCLIDCSDTGMSNFRFWVSPILIRGVAVGMETPVSRSRLGVSMLPSAGDSIVRSFR